eukprot:365253-Chlamydomonas_euryale.AAC.12
MTGCKVAQIPCECMFGRRVRVRGCKMTCGKSRAMVGIGNVSFPCHMLHAEHDICLAIHHSAACGS